MNPGRCGRKCGADIQWHDRLRLRWDAERGGMPATTPSIAAVPLGEVSRRPAPRREDHPCRRQASDDFPAMNAAERIGPELMRTKMESKEAL